MIRAAAQARRRGPESLLFIAGHPVSHSISPAMHNAVIDRLGLPIRYIGLDIGSGLLEAFFKIVRRGNFLGGNITIPYKEEAAALADVRSEAVEVCGAANVIRVKDGKLFAENTDGAGFLDGAASAGMGKRFRRVVILGAGGAARGIAYELCRAGTREISILNRHPSRGKELGTLLSSRFPKTTFSNGKLDPSVMTKEFQGADLIVQSTSLGLLGEWENFPTEGVEKTTNFVDIIYRREGTALVRRLKKLGIPAIDGLPMLAYQAARSFFIWTGRKVSGEEYKIIARKTIASR